MEYDLSAEMSPSVLNEDNGLCYWGFVTTNRSCEQASYGRVCSEQISLHCLDVQSTDFAGKHDLMIWNREVSIRAMDGGSDSDRWRSTISADELRREERPRRCVLRSWPSELEDEPHNDG